MKIIGADACKDRLVYCVLDSENMPSDLRQYYLDGDNFKESYISAKGLKEIIKLKPDVLVLEPTGVNYTRFWIRKMSEAGIKIALIGHSQIKSYRKNLELPDKDDPADALAIGAYYAEHHAKPEKFVLLRDETTAKLRETALRLSHLVRLQSPAINRLKQDLAYALPEQMEASSNAVLFWRWMGGMSKSVRYDAIARDSIGSGITAEMQLEAYLLARVQAEERRVELELRSLLAHPQFAAYQKVMRKYGFGERAQAMMISQIYPLENFLDANKQPIVLVTKGKKSNAMTAKHISLRKVSKMLGVAPTREQSGKSKDVTKKAGSQLCRNALWLWLFSRIEASKSRLKNDTGEEIAIVFARYKASKPIKLARAKTIGKVVNRLFYDLVDAINSQN